MLGLDTFLAHGLYARMCESYRVHISCSWIGPSAPPGRLTGRPWTLSLALYAPGEINNSKPVYEPGKSTRYRWRLLSNTTAQHSLAVPLAEQCNLFGISVMETDCRVQRALMASYKYRPCVAPDPSHTRPIPDHISPHPTLSSCFDLSGTTASGHAF